ncbi:SANT and BTB domain regulator of class switch recombination-like [Hyalella azteca]|uniref:SANT and BTB domain regulator of class switch recombination-like n=1 Tax=Hyalella azteca TaxID=294128 RepID=A0A979FWH1_HYAAZ|nr:SANT and BTB domain regulator of class switch recombination-like [Hyalella azteca]
MSPLVTELLVFMHKHAQDVLLAQTNLSCLPDHLLNRLSRQFSHWEVEALQDPKDRLQGRLYSRLLQALCEACPAPTRGIFRTAATLYRCQDCGALVSRQIERLVECTCYNTHVTTTGAVYYLHSRDPTWSLTEHVKELKSSLKTWRLVYWRLWGQVHFLPCSTCGAVFGAGALRLCRKHKMDPQFSDAGELGPLTARGGDHYPCCGARALRFSPLPLRNGCQTSEHTVLLCRRPEEPWGGLHSIYDDLLTYQALVCPPACTLPPLQQGAVWRNVPLLPARSERSFLDRSCFLGRQVPPDTTYDGDEITSSSPRHGAQIQPGSKLNKTSLPAVTSEDQQYPVTVGGDKGPPSSSRGATSSSRGTTSLSRGPDVAKDDDVQDSDEDEGAPSKLLPPRMKAALQRKAARVKRALNFQ